MAAVPTPQGRSLEERVTWIEAQLGHLATRAWVLGGVVGGMVLAASISLVVVKLFAP